MEKQDGKAIWPMLAIAGALLLIAASVCLGAGIIGTAVLQNGAGFVGYFAACVLGLSGLVFLLIGLATDVSQPTLTRWVWTTLRVCSLAVLAFFAISAILYFIRMR